MQRVQDLNDESHQPDTNTDLWSARAFSVIATLGNHTEISDEVGEVLANLLAIAPDEVVANGTLMVFTAMAERAAAERIVP